MHHACTPLHMLHAGSIVQVVMRPYIYKSKIDSTQLGVDLFTAEKRNINSNPKGQNE